MNLKTDWFFVLLVILQMILSTAFAFKAVYG